MGHILGENHGGRPKMGPGCYESHWVREDQSEACILALIATCKSEEVPARYMLMLTGTSKI